MRKLILIVCSSLLWSCGNSSQKTKNETTSTQEKTETIQNSSKSSIVQDTTITSENKAIVEETEKLTETVESSSENVVTKNETMLSEDTMILEKDGSVIEKNAEVTEKTVAMVEQSAEEKEVSVKTIPADLQKEIAKKPAVKEKTIFMPDHSEWNSLLKKYVNNKGDVAYKSFKANESALQNYLDHLAENSPKESWSKNKKLAYYINLYNAATVKLILDNYPTKSIKDLKNPWGKDWVKTGDGKISLGDIEHKILRKMNEPRIHFAINCASFSCPKLLNVAFTSSNMETLLEQATKDFINDTTRNKISTEKLALSNIFKWYKKDFTENGSLIAYIKPYTKIEISNSKIKYLKYNWNLNEIK